MKKEPFIPNCHYLIKNSGNNFDTLFPEERNYSYFLALFNKHVGQIAILKAFRFFRNKFELLIQIKDISQIPPKYQDRLHQPFSNFFNAYSQSINRACGRTGSLFREHFKRHRIDEKYVQKLKHNMNESPVTIHNLPEHEVANRLKTEIRIPNPAPRKTPSRINRPSRIAKIAASAAIILTLCSFKPGRQKFDQNIPNDTIPGILNRYVSKFAEPKNKDSVFYPYEPFYDDSTGKYIAIGHLVHQHKIHAVSTSVKDSSITFYEYADHNWHVIGKQKLPEFTVLETQDLNFDGRKEVIARSYPNMNGNCGHTFFILSEKTGQFENAGFIFGRYEAVEKKLRYTYEGSWYANYIQTLYEWHNERLVPIRSVTLCLKKADMRHHAQWIVYEENPARSGDRMIRKFRKTFRPDKHQYIVDHIFDDNFQLK